MSEILNYCPECRSEYREGFTVCSDCAVPLVRRLDTDSGDHLVPLARETNFELVGELLDRLETEGVPYVVQAGTAVHLLDGEAADASKPRPWEARVWVPRSVHEAAVPIVEEIAAEWRADRGEQVAARYQHRME